MFLRLTLKKQHIVFDLLYTNEEDTMNFLIPKIVYESALDKFKGL